MAKTAKELFQRFQTPRYEPYLRRIRGTYRFHVDEVGDLFISVNEGEITAKESKEEADCSFRCSEQDFVDIAEGRSNLVTAILQGRVHVRGDAALALKVNSLTRAKAEERNAPVQEAQKQRGAA